RESDQGQNQQREEQAQQKHRDLKIERLFGLFGGEWHGLTLGLPDDQGAQDAEQCKPAEREENESGAARDPQQTAQMRRHRPVALLTGKFGIHSRVPLAVCYRCRILTAPRGYNRHPDHHTHSRRYGGVVVKFKPLLDRWKKDAAPALTAKTYSIRLPLDDASRLHALVELFPGRAPEEIITDLLHAGLDEIAAAMPYE